MTTRSTFITGAILTLVVAAIVPAKAEPARSFDAWGHRFTVPGTQATLIASATNSPNTASIAPKRSYASAKASAETVDAPSKPSIRTLNIWGARVDAPSH